MKDFFDFKDQFFGQAVNSDVYLVVGNVTTSSTQAGASLPLSGGGAEEVALHLGDKLQINSALMTEFCAEFNITEEAGIDANNSVFIGLLGGNYGSDLSNVAKRVGFIVEGKTIKFIGEDGTNSVAEDTAELLANRPNRVVINVARGWEQAEISVNGRPFGGYLDLTSIKGQGLQLTAQATGTAVNELILSSWSFRGRKSI